jgi:hypothetical protein
MDYCPFPVYYLADGRQKGHGNSSSPSTNRKNVNSSWLSLTSTGKPLSVSAPNVRFIYKDLAFMSLGYKGIIGGLP